MLKRLSDWTMRRLLSLNRDAAIHFGVPDDGYKWTISAWTYSQAIRGSQKAQEQVDWIDWCFWPGHCKEAYDATISGSEKIEHNSWRSKRGALRVLVFGWWALLTGKFP